MLKQLFSRNPAYIPHSPQQMAALLHAFKTVFTNNPLIYYWVHQIDAERFLFIDFFDASMLRYRGLEVLLIEGNSYSYYRLPGARVGGTGQVLPGDYKVSIHSPTGAGYLLQIKKNHLGRFELNRVAASSIHEFAHIELPIHVLEPSKFADELRAAITSGLEWAYQSYRSASAGGTASLHNPLAHAGVPEALKGLSEESDSLLWLLGQAISQGKTQS